MNDFQQLTNFSSKEQAQQNSRQQINLAPLIIKINRQNFVKALLLILVVAVLLVNNIQIIQIRRSIETLENVDFQLEKSIKDNYHLIQEEEKERIQVNSDIMDKFSKYLAQIKNTLQKDVNQMLMEINTSKKNINKIKKNLNQIPKKNIGQDLKQKNPIKQTRNQSQNEKNETGLNLETQPLLKQLKILQNTLAFVLQQSKTQYHQKKIEYIKSLILDKPEQRQALYTSLGNLKLKHQNVILSKEINQNQQLIHARLSKEYQFDEYKIELPFCLVVPTYNNAKNYRYLYNLQSMMNLNYLNFKVIIVDDFSQDLTYELILQHLAQHPEIQNVEVIRNDEHMTAVPSIDRAIRQYCDEQDIAVLIDGDDQLLVRDSLKVFNAVYQKQKVDVAYSNHFQLYWHQNLIKYGWSQTYSYDQIKGNSYRQVPQKISHLRTFKVALYLKIQPQDLKDKDGKWYTSTYDEVICLPILQMSCGRIAYVKEYFYLYNFGIGTNDLMVNASLQKQIADTIKYSKPRYRCLDD